MSTTNSAIKTTRTLQEHVVLFGHPADPEVLQSKKKIEQAGRPVEFGSEEPNPSDTLAAPAKQ